jgi:hypothetical protein
LNDPAVNPLVQQFIQDHISSVAQLEILLLLQTNPQQSWSPQTIARELRIEPAGALQQLMQLAASCLVREHPPQEFVFAPATGELQAAVTALAQEYLIRRVTVIGLIFAKPPAPPAGAGIRAFSDAFKLRKDPECPP